MSKDTKISYFVVVVEPMNNAKLHRAYEPVKKRCLDVGDERQRYHVQTRRSVRIKQQPKSHKAAKVKHRGNQTG